MGTFVDVTSANVTVSIQVIAHVRGSNNPLKMLFLQFVLLSFDVFNEALMALTLITGIAKHYGM